MMFKDNMSKKIIKIISVFLVLIFLITVIIVIPYASINANAGAFKASDVFKDISASDWYYVYVERLYGDGLINGVTDNLYAPDSTVKTSEVAAMITRYLGLEYAALRSREHLAENKIEGANLWYSGYIQLLYDLNILDESYLAYYDIKTAQNGETIISANSAILIDSPIKRMDMVKLIVASFELRNNKIKSGKLKGEVGGNGNEFISGGGYDSETLGSIPGRIRDYGNIPENYKIYFQKCYYNGIVRGNEVGDVLPFDNLKRSELAKIIAAVLYFDLRGEDIRNIPASCKITGISSEDYSISSVDGGYILKKEKAEQILREQAKNIKTSVSKANDSVSIYISRKNIIPAGFIDEIYIYKYDSGATSEAGKMNGSTNTSEYFPKENSFILQKSNPDTNNNSGFLGYVYLVLRDLSRGGEIAGAVMLDVDNSGNLKDALVYDLP